MSLDQLNHDLDHDVARDRWGRYLITPPGAARAVGYVRVTTLSDSLDDRHNLENWLKRQVVIGLILDEKAERSEDLLDTIRTYPNNDKKLDEVCEKAQEIAGATEAAKKGALIHEATAHADLGQLFLPKYQRFVDEYHHLLASHGFEVVEGMVEQIVLLENLFLPNGEPCYVAGTFDRLLREIQTGKLFVGDIKTGRLGFEQSWAAQLSAYAHGECIYNPVTTERSPMPDVDQERAVIIHLPADGGPSGLYALDIVAGWEAFKQALWVRGWRKQKVRSNIGLAPQPQLPLELADDRVDPSTHRALLRDWFKQGRTTAAVNLYHRWRTQAAGELEFQTPTRARFDRIRAAWKLATIVATYEEHADLVAASVVGAAMVEVDGTWSYPVWTLSHADTVALIALLDTKRVDVTATFIGDTPDFSIIFTEATR